MTKVHQEITEHEEHEHTHDPNEHHHHEHSHEHHPHTHTHDRGWWAAFAQALHLPGYAHTHDRSKLLSDISTDDNALAIRTVWLALLALGMTTVLQVVIFLASGSVALLADTVHNLGDALNSLPLLIAFYLARRSANPRYTYGYHRAEDIAGVFIVVSIAFSAAFILWESVQKLIHPRPLENLGWVAAAAVIGFLGNEIVALLQIRVGRKIGSEAMVADGLHAQTDGLTSLAVLIAVVGAWLGFPIIDPIIGVLIGITILFITRDATRAMWYRLMDAVDPKLVETAKQVITEHENVMHIEKLQMRWLGHHLYAEILIALDADLTVAQGEEITDHLAHHLYHALPTLADATIAIVPWNREKRTFWQETEHHRSQAIVA